MSIGQISQLMTQQPQTKSNLVSTISNSLSCANTSNSTAIAQVPPTPVTNIPSLDQQDVEREEDFRFAREAFRNIIAKGKDSVEELADIASECESSRDYEVLSSLIRSMGETIERLNNLHTTRREVFLMGNEEIEENDNHAFIGSTQELLEQIQKSLEEKHPEEGTIEAEVVDEEDENA